MKTKLKQSVILTFGALLLNACAGQPSIPKVEQAEVDKYEKAYMAEYEHIKQKNMNVKPSFKLVQPKNKKEACKVWTSINPNDDKTIKSDYSLYWDGNCKDGYAYGLGREIENTMLSNMQQIGYYQDGKVQNYCIKFDPLNGLTVDGECSYSRDKQVHYVRTLIKDKQGDLQISYNFGVGMSKNTPAMFMATFPFSNIIKYMKAYPNFAYTIVDYTKNEFDNRKYEFLLVNKKVKANGFGFATFKNGYTNAGEMKNGTLLRRVQLPQNYFNKANSIFSEIKREANLALEAQRKALIIKERYKKKICKDSIKVDFMDNEEYKAICHEDEYYAKLKQKIDIKLAKIEKQKQTRRTQQQQERLIQAKETEALAAQRQAEAIKEANNQRAWDNLNRSIQNTNTNTNMQLQQLNNNIMMYNLTPKRYDVYLH